MFPELNTAWLWLVVRVLTVGKIRKSTVFAYSEYTHFTAYSIGDFTTPNMEFHIKQY
jgi:hypothetical protein